MSNGLLRSFSFRSAGSWLLITTALAFLVTTIGNGWNSIGPGSWGPRLECSNRLVEVGRMEANEVRQLKFVLENVGWQPVIIERIVPDCSCAVTALENFELPPQHRVSVDVRFSAASQPGRFQRNLLVRSNSRNRTPFLLAVSGEVVPSLAGSH